MDWRRRSVVVAIGLSVTACGRAPLIVDGEPVGTTDDASGGPTTPPSESGPEPGVDDTTGTPAGTTTGGPLDDGSSTAPAVVDSTTGDRPDEDSSTGDVGDTGSSTSGDPTTTGTECNDVPGVYANCADGESCEAPSGECLATGNDGEGACTFECETACDCPAAPPTGNATVTCVDIVGPGGPDGDPDCYLSCEAGEACPDEQLCFGGLICVHANNTSVIVGSYEACDGGALICPPDHQCILDDPADPSSSTCLPSDCTDALGCPAAPMGGTVACGEIAGPGVDYCYLDCSGDVPCPDGWDCLFNIACVQALPM